MAKRTCDGCCKERSDVRSVGSDYNGDPDAPDLCFICRKESDRGRIWYFASQSYLDVREFDAL